MGDPPAIVVTSLFVKGDRVEVVVDVGDGVQRFEIRATRAGRRVEISSSRGSVEVTEVTRSGRAVRTARFMAGRVVALVEHPAEDSPPDRSGPELGAGSALGPR
jgi:hypothetical protein